VLQVEVEVVNRSLFLRELREWRDDDTLPRPPSPALQPGDVGDGTQWRVFDYISQHPGVHLRQICRELGLAMGNVQYHVYRLEMAGRISSMRRGLYKFFYPSAFGEKQRDVLSVLSLETPRNLLLHLLDRPDSRQDDLARGVGVSQPTVSWHLKRLVDLGIIERRQVGKGVAYRVPQEISLVIASFIKSYHPNVGERWSSNLADIFISYSGEQGGDKEER